MLKEAEITDKTGVVYLTEDLHNAIGAFPGGTLNLYNPTFFLTGTGEYLRPRPETQVELSQSLLPYKLLSTTTGSELHDISALLLVLLVLAVASDNALTDYRTTFEVKNSLQKIKSYINQIDQVSTTQANSVSVQAERLREISGLKVERLAEIFGVSRTTYYKWIAGSPPHDIHRDHLFEVLALIEEASQRTGSPGATNAWLLTPTSPGGKKPIDYLAEKEYSTFRGFLLRVQTGQEIFRPLAPSKRVHIERSREEIEDALERLRPRAWGDEDNEP